MKERLSGIKDKTEGIDNLVKEKVKSKIFQPPTQKKSRKPGRLEKTKSTNDRNAGISRKPGQSHKNIILKSHRKGFPNLKKQMPINVQEPCRTPNGLDQKRNHINTEESNH